MVFDEMKSWYQPKSKPTFCTLSAISPTKPRVVLPTTSEASSSSTMSHHVRTPWSDKVVTLSVQTSQPLPVQTNITPTQSSSSYLLL